MGVFEVFTDYNHEQVVFCQDKVSGLKAIIAIHSTALGPSLGGTRMWQYANDDEALVDALRLSKGMTYKAAVAGLNLGGGKAVIIGNSATQKNELLFRTFGKFVEGLAGRYITAEDVGTSVRDMEYVRMETTYVTGISQTLGGSGDPSPVTGYGVYVGMKACANEMWGNDSLKNKKIVVQGAGKVASYLCEHLDSESAEIYVCDINEDRIKELASRVKVNVINPEEVYEIEADIFSPNALGAIINDETIDRIKAPIIAGGANNQLKDEKKHGKILMDKGVLYAPDYVINAGGLINVANELEGYIRDRALAQAESIYSVLKNIFKTSKEENIPTFEASNKIAEDRIKNISGLNRIYSGKSEFSGKFNHFFRR
ncbi:MAG: Glu/Leu/Phe/Val dehydrogenase [Ignavibacteriaceae bacterium]|nr:Glu/Leu/Phe/Val dehydrogenase [Ignavibacteriaceae bacterium]